MKINEVQTYDDLKQFLRTWTSMHDGPDYDFVGAHHLFLAILTNLAEFHLETDLENLSETSPVLDRQQRTYLEKLLRLN